MSAIPAILSACTNEIRVVLLATLSLTPRVVLPILVLQVDYMVVASWRAYCSWFLHSLNSYTFTSRDDLALLNARAAQELNARYALLTRDAACTDGETSCVNGQFAQCTNGQFVLTPCGPGTQCVALPLGLAPGTRYVMPYSKNFRVSY